MNEREKRAWEAYLVLIPGTPRTSYGYVVEAAFMAADAFERVRAEKSDVTQSEREDALRVVVAYAIRGASISVDSRLTGDLNDAVRKLGVEE